MQKDDEIKEILQVLHREKGFDFTGYDLSLIKKNIINRFLPTNTSTNKEYLKYLLEVPEEIDNFINELTINVSHFFRDPLTFEFISEIIIPETFTRILQEKMNSIRIWSAGCSGGEESYSMAILIDKYLKRENRAMKADIFSTDIDSKILAAAKKGIFGADKMMEVKYDILNTYFKNKNGMFMVDPGLKKMIRFSFYNLVDKKTFTPPESVFGYFDIVLCRNVLIYYTPEYQELIFNKLYRSLKPGAYLILGEVEIPPGIYINKFKQISAYCNIFQRNE